MQKEKRLKMMTKKTWNGYRSIQGLLQTYENIDCRQSGIPTERTK